MVAAGLLAASDRHDEASRLIDGLKPAQVGGVDEMNRLRATLAHMDAAGEKLLAQSSFVVQRPSASADASGGVKALTAAADAAIAEMQVWVQQMQGGLVGR